MVLKSKRSFNDHLQVMKDWSCGSEFDIWAEEQKKAYINGTLTDVEITGIESIPEWTWDTEPDSDFNELSYEVQLEIFDQLTWCVEQKITYKSGGLSKKKIAQLEQVPNWTWDIDMNILKYLW